MRAKALDIKTSANQTVIPIASRQSTKSTCCYCGVGCGVIIHSENDTIVAVEGDPEHPANYGRLCTKGSTLHLTARLDARGLYPEVRHLRHAPREVTTWDHALDHVVDKFAEIINTHGPDAVGFYISGQLLTEDYYVFNKLAKGLIGTNNVDTNSRLCMSSAVAGYKLTLGADAPPACYEDIDATNCLFIAGSNTAFAHPIIFRRIEEAKANNPDMKMIVVDPRYTDTAQLADLHLAILPGTDVALFHAMLHVMLQEALIDQAYIAQFTEGFDALKTTVSGYSPQNAAKICGVSAEAIIQAARWFAKGPALSMYCMGLNQSIQGTDKNAALINLHLATGQIGKPGAGPFSLTGQPNAMGGREVGGMSNLLSGHRNLANPAHRTEVAALWNIDAVPAKPGKTAVEMFEAVKKGDIKAIWIACTNPAHSMPDLNNVLASLEQAELVVLQDAFNNTDSNQYADVFLPASTWGEKEGTVTNSERRITRVQPAVSKPGEARHDWEIAVDFANRLASKLDKPNHLFPYETTESIFNEHRETTRGRDLDITGLSYPLLVQDGPQQWPFYPGESHGKARLYADGVFATPNGKAQFYDAKYQTTADQVCKQYPLHLLTGRLRDQWHGMSRTGTVAQLYNHVETPVLTMHPDTITARQLKEGDIVRMYNQRGALTVKLHASDSVKPNETFMPMHWGSQFMQGLGVNALTTSAFDPTSKQPELKHTVINIEPLDLPWQMTVLRVCTDEALVAKIRTVLSQFTYATCSLYGRENSVLVLEVAHESGPNDEVITHLDTLLGMTDTQRMLQYEDPQRDISKRLLIENNRLTGARLIGETLASTWLKQVMLEDDFPADLRQWALAPVGKAPTGKPARGRIICNCLDVSETEIVATCQSGADLNTLQQTHRCGTQCGSCLPELKRLVAQHNPSTS